MITLKISCLKGNLIAKKIRKYIYYSIGCVTCVSVCEVGRSVVNSGVISRSDPGFFSSLQFVNLFKWHVGFSLDDVDGLDGLDEVFLFPLGESYSINLGFTPSKPSKPSTSSTPPYQHT